MTEYYPALRSVHITCAMATITLFVLRGGLMLTDSPLLRSPLLRYQPHVVDTLLLATAVMLTIAIRQYPLATPWLTAKLLLLVAYVVLGSIAAPAAGRSASGSLRSWRRCSRSVSWSRSPARTTRSGSWRREHPEGTPVFRRPTAPARVGCHAERRDPGAADPQPPPAGRALARADASTHG